MKTVRRMIICGLDLLAFLSYVVVLNCCIRQEFQISALFGVAMGAIQGIRWIVRHIDEIREGR